MPLNRTVQNDALDLVADRRQLFRCQRVIDTFDRKSGETLAVSHVAPHTAPKALERSKPWCHQNLAGQQ
jgi:hypothetical protein